MIAARREAQLFGRPDQQGAAARLWRRSLVEQRTVRLGIGSDAPLGRQPRITSRLPGTCCRDPMGDRRAALGRRRQSQIPRRNRGDLDVEVDAVKQRARQPRLILLRATLRPGAAKWPQRHGFIAPTS